MSIGQRKAGAVVDCTTCGRSVVVPMKSEPLGRRATKPRPGTATPPWERPDTAPTRPPEPGPAQPADALPGRRPRGEPDRPVTDEKPQLRLRREESEEELDLTPMVDVTFLLLIFFMLTASFTLQKTFEMPDQPPEQEAAQQAPTLEELENDSVLVRIEADNSILVDDEKTAPEQLPEKIRRARSTGRPGLVIAPDDRSLHETTVLVIDAASAVGMDQVQLALPASSQ
jgi:biopolymer transport protein ExbD